VGSFYVVYMVRHGNRDAVIAALGERMAKVSDVEDGLIAIMDNDIEGPGILDVDEIALELSRSLAAPVLRVMNYDDDVLTYLLVESGKVVDTYDSTPGYFEGHPVDPAGGDAAALCRAFGMGDPAAVEAILRRPRSDYVFSSNRHRDLVRAMGFPPFFEKN
jgi:hypothetical protein